MKRETLGRMRGEKNGKIEREGAKENGRKRERKGEWLIKMMREKKRIKGGNRETKRNKNKHTQRERIE